MKHFYSILILLTCMVCAHQISAQQNNALILKTGAVQLSPNLNEFIANPSLNTSTYKLIQFNATPTPDVKKTLQNNGIQFLEYVPNHAFVIKFNTSNGLDFLIGKNIKGIYELPHNLKLDYRLIDWTIPSHAKAPNDQVKVAIIAMNGIEIKNHGDDFERYTITPYAFGGDKRFAYCELSKNQIQTLVTEPWVRYIEIVDEPGVPESTEGRSVQKSNLINSDLSNGLSYNADGVKLLVRDDGLVGPHVDYQGRLFNLTTDGTGTHGDGVAGVMGGAGNINPAYEGGASGADIYVINYVSNFQDTTLGLHLYDSVMITNSSYSNGCNAGYTSTTQTVDNQIFNNQTLMHVFSAGNSNNNNCGYGAGNQWGNITGGHKMGKNVITVANLFNDASLVSSSSRGPAHDGRIKPDMAAHGQGQISTAPNNQYMSFGGTSAAAPSLAGNLAQLLQAYKNLNGGNNPKSSLLKAAAMNSATDLGNPGPDYRYGYGLINTTRAYDIIANNQYLFSTIAQSGSNNHTVTVPAGTGQLRVMVYWHDPAGAVSTNKALVNNLDLTVNTTLLPLILDPTPNATTLNNPAAPGVDTLNNMEQVVVNNPAPGNYTVQINGTQVPMGPQEYVLVYSFIKDEIKVTYPVGGESLIPGNSEIIHWDAYGNTGSFTIAYSTNNGGSWTTIGTAPGDERNISWVVPSMNTGDALIRVSRSTQNDISDETFNIYPVPTFTIQNNNASSVLLNWNTITGATNYYIYRLGNKFMELIDSSTTNQYTLNGLIGGEDLWLSVSANTASIKGERANAQNFVFNPFGSCGGCINSITNFPHVESFETGFGLFCQSNNDDIDFTNWSGNTPSSNTGPNAASTGSEYIYVEATNPNFPSKVAILGSPCYNLVNKPTAQLKFDYHMYGAAMGTLEVEVSTDGGLNWSATPVWTKSGDQGNQWFTDSVSFTSYQTNQTAYRFVGTTGTSFTSDISIDNIIFTAPTQVALPVQYSNWEVNWQRNNALLRWTILTDENNSYFDIERSLDNISFEKIGTVEAKIDASTSQDYSFMDRDAKYLPSNKIYYRLRQVDKDQKSSLTNVLSLINNNIINYTLLPNPSNGIFHLNTSENLRSIQVINTYGQQVQSITIGTNHVVHLNLSGYASGVYMVILRDKSNQLHRIKVSLL